MATKDIVLIALFAALVAALGVVPNITLPMAGGVPITAQSMGVMLAGALLGAKRGGLAIVLFLVLVAVAQGCSLVHPVAFCSASLLAHLSSAICLIVTLGSPLFYKA